MDTLYEAFNKTVETYSDHAFLCVPPLAKRNYYPEGIEFTYSAASEQVERIKQVYAQAGYGYGQRVGFLLENRPEYVFHLLALNALGASCVPINPDYRHEEMLYQMSHSDADLVVTLESRLADMHAVAGARERPLRVVADTDFFEKLPSPDKMPATGAPCLMSEASLLYTSGTTGRPKGCILNNDYHLTAANWYADMSGLIDIRPGKERLYNPLPLYHMNAAIVSLGCMLVTGGCLIIPDRFHPSGWWQDINETKATIIHYLGVVPPMLLNQPDNDLERSHSVRFGIGGGVDPDLHGVFEKRYGFPLYEVWGMTETGRIFNVNSEPRQIDTRAFGRPYGEFEAKIADEDGLELPRGEQGELLVRAAGDNPRKGFFAGYLNNEEATEDAWSGGWFHTGDTVIQDETGMLYFVDRKKNIIRRAGENIAAAEVEAALQAHDAIAQIAVIAVPDDIREEEVMACIVLIEGYENTLELAEELFEFGFAKLAYFKPPGWILFVDSLPTTGTQKIQKAQIFDADVNPTETPGIYDFRKLKKMQRTLVS